MYEAVYAHPDGDATVARCALTAAESGFDGVVVRNRHDAEPSVDAEAVREEYGVDVVRGVTVAVDAVSSARGHVGRLRPERTLVAVAGGDPEMNRFAVEDERVDVLAGPMRGAGDVNHVLARAAAKNDVHVEFDLGRVLRTEGGRRVTAIQDLRKLRELLADADAPFVVSAAPHSHLHVRAPRELRAVAEQIGFDRETVDEGLSAWGEIAARNRERLSAEFIAPGIERSDDETER